LKGNKSARYFVIAWSFVVVGTMLFIASMAGIVPRTPFTEYAQTIGSVIEVILLSFALAERINRERRSREEAQFQALRITEQLALERAEKIKAQEMALHFQREISENLELRVKERTETLEQTMQALAAVNRQLERISITDALTDLYNRRYFDEQLAIEIKRANRAQKPIAVMFVDLDHFKQINDQYGHSSGDRCLQDVARALQETASRPGDILARYGGEEFVLLLPNTDRQQALGFAERLRQAVEDLVVDVDGVRIAVSASIGLAAWIPAEREPSRNLLDAADAALYQAKHDGRNQVKVASG
jgi:two-component system, sensor histidine kinase LadS